MKEKLDKRLEALPASFWTKISQIDEIKGKWIQGLNLHPQILGRLRKSVLITSTGASTRIEGARLSDEEVGRLMANLREYKMTERDQQEIRGYFELLKKIFEQGATIDFKESNILHFHKDLLRYVTKDERHRGSYKSMDNAVRMFDSKGRDLGVIFETVSPYLVPKAMAELVDWTNQSLKTERWHPLLVIGNFIVEFLRIHPFQDGNGRLSRILTNLLMLRSGYDYVPYVSQEKIVEDNKTNYYVALRKSQQTIGSKKEDITVWMEFLADVLLRQAELALALLENNNIENVLSQRQLAVWQYLQQVKEASAGDVEQATKLPRATVNQVLRKLLKLKKIQPYGLGRAVRYRVVR